jgi:hypothetical protein
MQVTINIPEGIIRTCSKCGWNKEQTKKVFVEYLQEVTSHLYNQFEIDFDNWINDEDTQEFLDNL